LHHLALETCIGSVEDAERIWERWTAAHGKQASPMLRRTGEKAHRVLLSAQWRKKHPEWAREWETWLEGMARGLIVKKEPQKSLDVYLPLFRQAGKTNSPLFRVVRFVSPLVKSPDDLPYFYVPDYPVEVARAHSIFSLLKGDRTQSLEILAGCYWLGASLNGGETRSERLTGIRIRTIAMSGLEMHALNGCETAEDLKIAWNMLEDLANLPGQATDSSFVDIIHSPIVGDMKLSGPLASELVWLINEQRKGDVQFAILRTAVAARYRFLTTGTFPKSSAGFGPLLPREPLDDCFAASAPLHVLNKHDGFYIYSVGPDGQDDTAAITYDPSNGTVSGGDISLRIPREREYPFPASGVRANTAAELLKMFPNGLPPDPFPDASYAGSRHRPLNIIASSEADWKSCMAHGATKDAIPLDRCSPSQDIFTESPPGADAPTSSVIVFSFGPDNGEREHVSLLHLTGADVFTTYSVPAARYQTVFPPNAPSYDPLPPSSLPLSGTLRERMAIRSIRNKWEAYRYPAVNPDAYPFWQPAYDPTNGSHSEGNLYLKIPPP